MTVLEIMKMNKEYCLRYDEIPNELQIKAKTLCWEYNQSSPMEDEKRKEILEGSCVVNCNKTAITSGCPERWSLRRRGRTGTRGKPALY